MKYLVPIDPEIDELEQYGFISPGCLVDGWRRKLNLFLPVSESTRRIKGNVVSNIAYRMQVLEFFHGLISFHYKNLQLGQNGTLHSSVLRMLIMTYSIYVYCVCEGIGTYLTRYIRPNLENLKIEHGMWSKVMAEHFSKIDFPNDSSLARKRRRLYKKYLDNLRIMRDRVHLDEPMTRTDYNIFDIKQFKTASLIIRVLVKRYIDLKSPNFVTVT